MMISNGPASVSVSIEQEEEGPLGDGLARVFNLYCRPDYRRQGYASQVMRKLTEWADKEHYRLYLSVQKYGKNEGLGNEELIEFYKKFGFTIQHPNSPNFVAMVRAWQ